MRTTWAQVLSALMAAGCAAPVEEPATVAAPIIAGAANPGDPAIVELFAIGKTSLAKCTATLVSPRVLLTAAHCVYGSRGARFGVFLGADDRKITGKDLLPTSAAVYDPLYNDDPGAGHDIAVIVLATPLALATVPINRAALAASAVGKPARYVGYGLTNGVNATGDGLKRQATAPIAQVTRQLIRIATNPHGTCHGDSGGPLLMDNGAGEAVIGVVSFGNDATCRRDSYFQRLDTQVAWVDEQIKKYDPGAAVPDGGPGSGGGDAAAADARAADTAGAPDAGAQDLGTAPDSAPSVLPDAAMPRARPPDARAPAGGEDAADGDESAFSQSVAASACALAPPRAPTAGVAWVAGLLLVCACLARRRRSGRPGGSRRRPALTRSRRR